MRAWTRATTWTMCGFCVNETIKPGDPVLRITGIGAEKIRCGKCAGPVPPDLPARVERVKPASPAPVRLAGLLPLDWKTRGAGDREPGEEG